MYSIDYVVYDEGGLVPLHSFLEDLKIKQSNLEMQSENIIMCAMTLNDR